MSQSKIVKTNFGQSSQSTFTFPNKHFHLGSPFLVFNNYPPLPYARSVTPDS